MAEPHPQSSWRLGRGTVTGRRVFFELLGPEDAAVPPLRVTVALADGSGVELTGKALRPSPRKPGNIAFDLPPGLVKAVRVELAGDPPGSALPAAPEFEIGDLLPAAEDGRLPSVFLRKKRIKHVGTLRFMAEQLLESDQYGPLVKTEAVKVLGYMAVEDGDPQAVEWALSLLDAKLAEVRERFRSVKGSSKENPTHAEISLNFIRNLALLSLGRYAEALALMTDFTRHEASVAQAPIIAFNLTQALLLHGWILARAGQSEAATQQLRAVIAVFRAAAQNMPTSKAKMFAELGASLQAATVACDLLAGLTGRSVMEWAGYHGAMNMATRFSRLSTHASQARLAEHLEKAAQHLAHGDAVSV